MSDLSRRIAASFRDPRGLCEKLGLSRGSKRLGRGGIQILCPAHNEKSPSCSVSIGTDGAVFMHCFGCNQSGDALKLIALARDLDIKAQYKAVLQEACELAGLHAELEELLGGQPRESREPTPVPDLPIARAYPPQDELSAFWATCLGVTWDNAATGLLRARGVDPEAVERLDLARTPADATPLPAWANYQRRSWLDTGHRMILPVYDAQGDMRSVRAWRVLKSEDYCAPLWEFPPPKRLPPAGFRASELVLANKVGLCMLRGEPVLNPIVVCEGESDFITRATLNPELPILGLWSGSWTEAFAKRIAYGSEVVVRTHRDRAGDGYALKVLESVRGRAQVYRLSIDQEDAA